MALAFKEAARADAVEVAVDIQLEQIAGMVGRTAGRCGHGTAKAECLKIKLIDERIDEANRIVIRNILVEGWREE